LGDYIERLEYELKVIKEMGFNSYFLIVSDYVRWAKNNTISVGPGRGSGAGSLLAWLVEITDVDPLLFDLLFERFLNPARISMPDFDIDFEDTLREKVIDYVTEKYGADRVCAIGTFMKMASKAAFKDAARTL
jgi:DNA polymerase-3 subunit alpha